MKSSWSYLDLTALGRQEAREDSPAGYPQTLERGGDPLARAGLDPLRDNLERALAAPG
jgi:hypothetical protein